MILGGKTIIDEQANGNIIIEPFDISMVGPNSVDYHLGNSIKKVLPNKFFWIDPNIKQKYKEYTLTKKGKIIWPWQLWLGHTVEILGSDKYTFQVVGRSSIGRMGLWNEISAGLADVGFFGQITLELNSVLPFRIFPGMRIGQAYFHIVTDNEILYKNTGRYPNQKGSVESKYSE